MAVNILLADDHRMVREGIRCLLENVSEFNVVGEAADGYECISLVNKTKPNIVLLDIDMPDMNGIDTLRIIKEQKMICKVIMLTRHNEIDYLMKALEIGCDGYILKDSSFDTLLKAIEPNMMPILNSNLQEKSNVKKRISELTKREIDVLKMIASGAFNKEIAITLNISERTVKNHISNIFKKIEVSDRTQAAVFAIKNGIITIK